MSAFLMIVLSCSSNSLSNQRVVFGPILWGLGMIPFLAQFQTVGIEQLYRLATCLSDMKDIINTSKIASKCAYAVCAPVSLVKSSSLISKQQSHLF